MEVFFGFVLLLLVGAIVVLFAMVGELAARVGGSSTANRSTSVEPLEDARLGHVPSSWPAGLETVEPRASDHHGAVLLVLSTVCASCRDVARQLSAASEDGRPASFGVVVTCGDADSGSAFVDGYGLGGRPHHVDVDGEWVRNEFNIQSSPVAVIFAHSAVAAVLQFNDVEALVAATDEVLAEHQHKEVVQ